MNATLPLLLVTSLFLLGCVGGDGSVLKKNQPLYQQVIDRCQKGEIKTEEEKGTKVQGGSVRPPFSAQLPVDLKAASVDGEIYLPCMSSGRRLIIFKTWVGKGFNMEGFLYVANALTSTDITKDYYGHQVLVIDPVALVLEKKLDSHWYKVSYKLD